MVIISMLVFQVLINLVELSGREKVIVMRIIICTILDPQREGPMNSVLSVSQSRKSSPRKFLKFGMKVGDHY